MNLLLILKEPILLGEEVWEQRSKTIGLVDSNTNRVTNFKDKIRSQFDSNQVLDKRFKYLISEEGNEDQKHIHVFVKFEEKQFLTLKNKIFLFEEDELIIKYYINKVYYTAAYVLYLLYQFVYIIIILYQTKKFYLVYEQ